jgi:hypothetical protein
MRIDWQAYLDGSLDAEARALADQQLRNDPSAQKELAGLKAFVSSVRNACLCEEVPLERLNRLVPEPKSESLRSSNYRTRWVYGLAAAAVLAFAFFRFGTQGPDPSVPDFATNDPQVASRWASAKLSMNIPALDLGSDATLFRAHSYGERCCFDYKVKGKAYHVNIERNKDQSFEGRSIKLDSGTTAFVGRGVKWSQGAYQMYVVGPDEDVAIDVANRTSSQLQRI